MLQTHTTCARLVVVVYAHFSALLHNGLYLYTYILRMYLPPPFLETWKPKHRHMHDLSTAGTTASISIIRKDRMFIANVGDSTVVLGTRSETHQSTYPATLEALILTKDHSQQIVQNERESKPLVVA